MNSSSSIGPVFLTLTFLALASATFIVIKRLPADEAGGPRVLTPQVLTPKQMELVRPQKVFVPPLEPSPGPPVTSPDIPDATASKADLWQYGERYLGWQAVADVDLGSYSDAELRGWLEKDMLLYFQAQAPSSESQELSAVEHSE